MKRLIHFLVLFCSIFFLVKQNLFAQNVDFIKTHKKNTIVLKSDSVSEKAAIMTKRNTTKKGAKFSAAIEGDSAQIEKKVNNITQGLIAYYPFNNSVRDESGYGNHGERHGVNFEKDLSGTPKGSCRFDGIDDYIKIPVNINPDVVPEITIAAWVYSTGGSKKERTIISHDDGGYDRALLAGEIERSERWGWLAYNGKRHIQLKSWKPDNRLPYRGGKWIFLAVSYNQNDKTVTIYADGKMINGQANIYQGHDYTLIGGHPNDRFYFGGYIDEVRFYNRILGKHELDQLRLLKKVGADWAPKKKEYFYTVTSTNLRVMTQPTVNSRKIGTVTKGDTLAALDIVRSKDGSEFQWLKFKFRGKAGYVSKKYLERHEKPGTPIARWTQFTQKYLDMKKWPFWILLIVLVLIIGLSILYFYSIDCWLIRLSGKNSEPGSPRPILVAGGTAVLLAFFTLFWRQSVTYYFLENFLLWPVGQGFVIWIVWILTIVLFQNFVGIVINSISMAGFKTGLLRIVIVTFLSALTFVTTYIITLYSIILLIIIVLITIASITAASSMMTSRES